MAASGSASGTGAKEELSLEDQDRLSRQLAVYGTSTTLRLMKTRVLLLGLRGVGAEVAKNVILAGPGSVSLYDPAPVKAEDLGLNFYATAEHVAAGTRLDEATVERFDGLSPSTRVDVLAVGEGGFTAEHCAGFDVVVACDEKITRSMREGINSFCRAQSPQIGFIMADVRGVAGRLFVDYGDAHRVEDKDGSRPTPFPIRLITPTEDKDGKALETTTIQYIITEEEAHAGDTNANPFDEGTQISLTGVGGKLGEALNAVLDADGIPRHFTVKENKIFRREKGKLGGEYHAIIDFNMRDAGLDFSQGASSPFVAVAKLPEDMAFPSLADASLKPKLLGDENRFKVYGKPVLQSVHAAFEGLDRVLEARGSDAGPVPAGDEEGVTEIVEATIAEAKAFVERAKAADASCTELDMTEFYAPVCEEIDETVVRQVAENAGAQFFGLSAFVGGMAAQEVIKHTGMFVPIRSHLYVEALPALPEREGEGGDGEGEGAAAEGDEGDKVELTPDKFDAVKIKAGERVRKGDRYDHMRLIFGETVVTRLRNLRVFLVGAGAIGCEMIKNFVMSGVGCSEGDGDLHGEVIVTDMDEVEISNLNRQFLFSLEDVSHPKSQGASRAAKAINPDLRTTVLTDAVGARTEVAGKFDSAFWDSLDVICNALDNLQARLYTDTKCVVHKLPLLDCGTLGMSANSVTVVPPITQSWDDGKEHPDPKRDNQSCTVKEFPYKVEHCIAWAKARFAESFSSAVQVAVRLRDDPAGFVAEKEKLAKKPSGAITDAMCEDLERDLEELLATEKLLKRSTGGSYAGCVKAAFKLFTEHYRDSILKLLHIHPADQADATGSFWGSEGRRLPTPVATPDLSDATQLAFLSHAAALFATVTGVDVPENFNDVALLQPLIDAAAAEDTPWAPKEKAGESAGAASGGGGEGGEAAEEEDPYDKHKKLRKRVKKALARLSERAEDEAFKSIALLPQKFEKDDDTNHHVDFVHAATNLRAAVYGIDPAERHYVKRQAGGMLPALSTTTTAISGHVLGELLKIVMGKPLEALSCVFMNLAVNVISCTEPTDAYISRVGKDCPLHEGRGRGTVGMCVPSDPLTLWDSVVVDEGPLSINDLVKHVQDKYEGLIIKYLFIPQGYGPKERTLWGSVGGYAESGGRFVSEVFDERVGVTGIPAESRRLLPLVVFPQTLPEDKHVAVYRIAYFTAK